MKNASLMNKTTANLWRKLNPHSWRKTQLKWYYRNRERINKMFAYPTKEDDIADEWIQKKYG